MIRETNYIGFEEFLLHDDHAFFCGCLPESLLPNDTEFDAIWALHPEGFHEVRGRKGGWVKTPRWQQAYGKDYHYSGNTNHALPVPDILTPFLRWADEAVDTRLNGLLLNWYDAGLGHYISKHRDSIKNMVDGAPIVTISLGDERTFRLRPWKVPGSAIDFPTFHGAVFIMPFETNLEWTHEIPKRARQIGRRVSITLRAFEGT